MCAKNKQVVFAAYFPLLTANYHDYYFSVFFLYREFSETNRF